MSFVLHLHPLSSFCQKVLMALYETGTPFEPRMVNLGDAQARAAYLKLSPFGKIPTLEDTARGRAVNESTIIIEYLQQHDPGHLALIPRGADAALEARCGTASSITTCIIRCSAWSPTSCARRLSATPPASPRRARRCARPTT